MRSIGVPDCRIWAADDLLREITQDRKDGEHGVYGWIFAFSRTHD